MTLLAPAPAPAIAATSVLTRVAVVGAGARGIGTAETLCAAAGELMCVDLIDESPAPVGLVQYGTGKGIRLLGNVSVGRDVAAEELAEHYDTVIYATAEASDQEIVASMAEVLRSESFGAPGVLELLEERGVPFTSWSGAEAGRGPEPRRPRGIDEWRQVISVGLEVPVCDQ